MKKVFLLLIVLIWSNSFGQTYKIGAIFANSLFVKMDGTITVDDKKVIFETIYKDKKNVLEYDLVKKSNSVVYFTDGVMTHFLSFVDDKGKKKGFNYDTLVVYNFDKRQSDLQVMYYCKIQE
jgi:hypothetical protein